MLMNRTNPPDEGGLVGFQTLPLTNGEPQDAVGVPGHGAGARPGARNPTPALPFVRGGWLSLNPTSTLRFLREGWLSDQS